MTRGRTLRPHPDRTDPDGVSGRRGRLLRGGGACLALVPVGLVGAGVSQTGLGPVIAAMAGGQILVVSGAAALLGLALRRERRRGGAGRQRRE